MTGQTDKKWKRQPRSAQQGRRLNEFVWTCRGARLNEQGQPTALGCRPPAAAPRCCWWPTVVLTFHPSRTYVRLSRYATRTRSERERIRVGVNKRYEEHYDRNYDRRAAAAATPPPMPSGYGKAVRDWKPPWPPIRIAEGEWVLMRGSNQEPAAVVRTVRMGPRAGLFYRVVTWAPTSAGRALVGYFATLEEADRSVLFDTHAPPKGPPNGVP